MGNMDDLLRMMNQGRADDARDVAAPAHELTMEEQEAEMQKMLHPAQEDSGTSGDEDAANSLADAQSFGGKATGSAADAGDGLDNDPAKDNLAKQLSADKRLGIDPAKDTMVKVYKIEEHMHARSAKRKDAIRRFKQAQLDAISARKEQVKLESVDPLGDLLDVMGDLQGTGAASALSGAFKVSKSNDAASLVASWNKQETPASRR